MPQMLEFPGDFVHNAPKVLEYPEDFVHNAPKKLEFCETTASVTTFGSPPLVVLQSPNY